MADNVEVQYGFQLPNGEYLWEDYTRGALRHDPANVQKSSEARKAWREELRTIAKSVGVDPNWFIGQHKVVKRDIITTTSAPTVVGEATVAPEPEK